MLFSNSDAVKIILVTGGAGFIGSNFIGYFLNNHPDFAILNLDSLTYAGSLDNLAEMDNHKRYTFVKGDICDQRLVDSLFLDHSFDGVIHFAAESHVDNSIKGPLEFVRTNVFGTFTLLESARRAWMTEPFEVRPGCESKRFVQISTDEVFGSLGPTGLFTESTPYAPNSPYSASKASADMLVRSYHHTYGMNVVTTNCSNNFGPKQHDEKLIPTIIRNALTGRSIPIYGDGKNIRDWLYVVDHCAGVDLAFSNGKAGETYNIGGGNELTNIELANRICEILDRKFPRKDGASYKSQLSFVKDRAGHDRRYAIDASKIAGELGWTAKSTLEAGLGKTVDWYLHKYMALG
jgi:dTDP-glucose 4,6-dehydratase